MVFIRHNTVDDSGRWNKSNKRVRNLKFRKRWTRQPSPYAPLPAGARSRNMINRFGRSPTPVSQSIRSLAIIIGIYGFHICFSSNDHNCLWFFPKVFNSFSFHLFPVQVPVREGRLVNGAKGILRNNRMHFYRVVSYSFFSYFFLYGEVFVVCMIVIHRG